jgi:hypothetical protein
MPSAGYLRRQADICLRLALIASDEEASGRLLAIYHDYKAKADAMDAEAEVPRDGASRRIARRRKVRRGLTPGQTRIDASLIEARSFAAS